MKHSDPTEPIHTEVYFKRNYRLFSYSVIPVVKVKSRESTQDKCIISHTLKYLSERCINRVQDESLL